MMSMYDVFESIFGGGQVGDVSDVMKQMLDALNALFDVSNIQAMTLFLQSLAVAFLIVYFCMDLINHFSRDMITFEKVMVSFIKLIMGLVLIINVPSIIGSTLELATDVYNLVASNVTNVFKGRMPGEDGTNTLSFFKKEWTTWPAADADVSGIKDFFVGYGPMKKEIKADTVKDLMSETFSFSLKSMGIFILSALFWICCFVSRMAVYLAVISNTVSLIPRAMFTPLAIANIFDEGSRSGGITYIKKTFACLLTFAIILGILWGTSYLQSYLMLNVIGRMTLTNNVIMPNDIYDMASDWKTMAICIGTQLAGGIGCMKASSIANDILHVH